MRSQKVYVVLEHHTKKQDAVLHGVYANRNFAEAKKKKIEEKNKNHGYVCVLKKEVVRRKN